MPLNMSQYRVTVGIFNSRKISRYLKFEELPIWKWSNNLCKYDLIRYSLLFYICLCSLFFSRDSVLKITTKFCILLFLFFHIFEIVFAWLCSLLVMLSGDIEVNLGPEKKGKDCLSICHWNLDSISAYDYSKLVFLNSYNYLHKFDIICLCETYLNTHLNDGNLEISGHTLVRSDHPSNTKLGGVCLYYKYYYKYWLFKWMSNSWSYGWW